MVLYTFHLLIFWCMMYCTYGTQSNIVKQPKEIYLRFTMFNILLLSRVCTRHGRHFGGNGIKMRYSNLVFYVYLRKWFRFWGKFSRTALVLDNFM